MCHVGVIWIDSTSDSFGKRWNKTEKIQVYPQHGHVVDQFRCTFCIRQMHIYVEG
jgi:hypothetical protein